MFTLTPAHTHTHLLSCQHGHSVHTSTQTAAPNHKRSCRKKGLNKLFQCYFIFSTWLCSLVHCCSCWDLLHWQVQGAGLVLQGSLHQTISQWTHTHRHTPPSARQADDHVRVFPQCRGGLLCKQLAWLSSPEQTHFSPVHSPVLKP